MTSGLVDLLEKDSTNVDPARVINISSVADIEAESEGSLSDAGNGVWSCKSYLTFFRSHANLSSVQTTRAKQLVSASRIMLEVELISAVNHLTSQLAITLVRRHIKYVIFNSASSRLFNSFSTVSTPSSLGKWYPDVWLRI